MSGYSIITPDQRAEHLQSQGPKILLTGQYGIGKTYTIQTIPKHMKTIVLDIESGLMNLTDTNDLIRNAGFDSANVVIIPTETEKSIVDKRTTIMIENLRKEHEFTLISLEKLWNISKINLSGNVDLQKILLI